MFLGSCNSLILPRHRIGETNGRPSYGERIASGSYITVGASCSHRGDAETGGNSGGGLYYAFIT